MLTWDPDGPNMSPRSLAEAVLPRELEMENYEADRESMEVESPFTRTYETSQASQQSPRGGEFVQFIGELHDQEFNNSLYELATELEDSWSSKISNELAMGGGSFLPFAENQAQAYFAPLARETQSMIDKVSETFLRK